MKTIIFIVCFSFLLSNLQAEGKNSNWVQKLTKPSEHFQSLIEAAKLLGKNEAKKSYQIISKACDADKQLPPAEFVLAVMYIEYEKAGVGQGLLEQAAHKHPSFPGTYILLGNIALNQKRYAEASLLYNHSHTLVSKGNWETYQRDAFKEQIYIGQAAIAERYQDWDKMAKYFTKLLALRGADGQLQQRLAIVTFRSGKNEDIFEELEKAKKENPKLELPEFTMAKLYAGKNKSKEALKWVKQAIKKHGEDGSVRFTAAQWLYQKDDLRNAKKQAILAQKNGFDNASVSMFLALISREEKRYNDAIKILDVIYQKNPTNFQISNQLILTLIEFDKDKEKKKKALDLAKINFKLYPKNVTSITTLGWVSYKLGDVNSAEKLLSAVVKNGNATAEIAYYMAHVSFKKNRLQQVKEWLKIASSTKQHFMYKEEVEKWLKQLNKTPD